MTLSVCECTLTSVYCRICLIGNKSFYIIIIIIIITVDERGCTMFTVVVLCLFTVCRA